MGKKNFTQEQIVYALRPANFTWGARVPTASLPPTIPVFIL